MNRRTTFLMIASVVTLCLALYFRQEIQITFGDLGGSIQRIKLLIGLSKPCTSPITYSIGSVDSNFEISRTELLDSADEAIQVWESEINRNLFEYVQDGGDLSINLIYDYRQSATDKLQDLGSTISASKVDYDKLRIRYDSLRASYVSSKQALSSQIATYTSLKKSYEEQVSYWNKKGGAPKAEYAELDRMRKSLNDQARAITESENSLNQLIQTLNSTVTSLNRIAKELNLKVVDYNVIGETTGPEFDEGEYISDSDGQRINVYQFEDEAMLTKLLAHEFGHALNIDHSEDPISIMYFMNESDSLVPSSDDITLLKEACRIQ